jgi:hypothetical protein
MKTDNIRVKSTPSFKLKDDPKRQYIPINLKKLFGFLPETIIIEKVHGQNNRMIVRAVLTEEEIKKEDTLRKKVLEAAKGGEDEKTDNKSSDKKE